MVFARARVARLGAPWGGFLVVAELAAFDDFLFEMERVTAVGVSAALAARVDFRVGVGEVTVSAIWSVAMRLHAAPAAWGDLRLDLVVCGVGGHKRLRAALAALRVRTVWLVNGN